MFPVYLVHSNKSWKYSQKKYHIKSLNEMAQEGAGRSYTRAACQSVAFYLNFFRRTEISTKVY